MACGNGTKSAATPAAAISATVIAPARGKSPTSAAASALAVSSMKGAAIRAQRRRPHKRRAVHRYAALPPGA